jgi:MFS family permease
LGLVLILISLTYALLPYGNNLMGWSSPYVLGGIAAGLVLMAVFAFVEIKANYPMFKLALFRIRSFAAGNLSLLLAGIARGGLQFMIVIWLQGIWLPLHGVAFENTPLQSAILMLPLLAGFILLGPISGYLSDKYGARTFSTVGMLINAVGFVLLASIAANFNYIYFAILLFVMGVGQGMFASPNTTAIMNSVPPEHRGVASGMRATFTNISLMFSMAIFFTLLISGMAISLPHDLYSSLLSQQVPVSEAARVASLPPTSALFAALLGYNPMKSLVNASVLASMPAANATTVVGNTFFPTILSAPFHEGMSGVLYLGAVMAVIAAIASALRGKRYVHGS